MNSRSRLLLTLLLGLTAGACASSGGTSTTGTPNNTTEPQGRTFPPGTEPARNTWTRSAAVYLDQAENTNDDDAKQARYTSALEQARLSIQNAPNNPLGYYQAGIALLGLRQYVEAGQMLDRAEEIYPRYVLETARIREQAWINLFNAAVTAANANDEATALEQFTLADAIFQGRPDARTQLAVIYTNRGDYETAVEWYQKTLETLRSEDRQYLPANVQAEWAEQESDVIFNLAQVYQRMDRRADAIALFREYLAANPNDATVKTQLALALAAEGQEAEAAAMFAEILNMSGLGDDEYYQIGIGLFNAGRFEDAVTAFERAASENEYFRDAVFNLSQALMAHVNAQEDAGTPEAELVALNERLAAVGEQLAQIDPLSRTSGLVLAQTYRNLADLTSGAASTAWRNKLLTQLEKLEALPFDVSNVSLAQSGPGRLRMTGTIQNLNVEPGSPINLRLSVLGPGGTPLATEQVTVTAPAREATASFSAEFAVTGEIVGWRYERI